MLCSDLLELFVGARLAGYSPRRQGVRHDWATPDETYRTLQIRRTQEWPQRSVGAATSICARVWDDREWNINPSTVSLPGWLLQSCPLVPPWKVAWYTPLRCHRSIASGQGDKPSTLYSHPEGLHIEAVLIYSVTSVGPHLGWAALSCILVSSWT